VVQGCGPASLDNPPEIQIRIADMEANKDIAGLDHWNRSERNQHSDLRAFSPTPGLRGAARRSWHEAYSRVFAGRSGRGQRLLELGCGGSSLLPYFAKAHGFAVHGVDYSEQGCELARRICAANGVEADILCADFFDAPARLRGSFDVVTSYGVVEHFSDTAETLRRFRSFLRPGGSMVTIVPNMLGLTGFGQKVLSRQVFDVHEKISLERLSTAHVSAGMQIEAEEYLMAVNFGVINPGDSPALVKRVAMTALRAATGAVWALESVVGPFRPNVTSSPYVMCVARNGEA
jgi:2-polyprenyl-3-methyl-5-hydroxy-6-metoxy-1,4-benzoquinol methylase